MGHRLICPSKAWEPPEEVADEAEEVFDKPQTFAARPGKRRPGALQYAPGALATLRGVERAAEICWVLGLGDLAVAVDVPLRWWQCQIL